MTRWTKTDMRTVRDAIAEAVPEAVFYESDYGWGLSVYVPGTHRGLDLFSIEYRVGEAGEPTPGMHKSTNIGDVPLVVAWLKGDA